MYYLKMPNDIRLNLVDGGVDQPDPKTLTLTFYNNDRFSFEDIKSMFADTDGITIYMCIVQDDGRETDEMVSTHHEEFTKLKGVEYQTEYDLWKVSLTIPDDTKERVSELEDALNFLLMGGEE